MLLHLVNKCYKLNQVVYMFILGSCLALNLSYSGFCDWSKTCVCFNIDCSCDKYCHKWNDCCSDIDDISCPPPGK